MSAADSSVALSGRLIWLNGPYGSGTDDLAAYLRDHWRVSVLDGEELGLVLQRGLPAGHDPGDVHDLPVWHRSLMRVAAELAYVVRPLVVMPATLYEAATVRLLLGWLQRQGVDVLHVVLWADETELRARIFDRFTDRDAKRWAIQHLRPALAGLSDVRDGVRLNAACEAPDQLAQDLLGPLVRQGWLTKEGQWTATPQ